MNNWSALTEDEVMNQFNDSEQSAYDTAKGDVKGLALADIIQKVADEIWLAYSQGGRWVDTQGAGTIPSGEKNRAIKMARWDYLVALPSGESLAKKRESEAKAAREYFLQIARREIRSSGGVAIARGGRRVRTRGFDGMSGT